MFSGSPRGDVLCRCTTGGKGYTVLYLMRHEPSDIRQHTELKQVHHKANGGTNSDFVLEKSIFNNVFEKDIRKVFIYKKAERLAKAIHLIAPAFVESPSLRDRLDSIAIGLVDAAIQPTSSARVALSRELLTLSSVLSIARTSGILSSMNAELIAHEAQNLLQEVAGYEEPRLFLDEAPTLSGIAKSAAKAEGHVLPSASPRPSRPSAKVATVHKGHIKDTHALDGHIKDRRDGILSVIKEKRNANIKDISTLIRGISEKTIQRELSVLITEGVVKKQGERRWSTYSMA